MGVFGVLEVFLELLGPQAALDHVKLVLGEVVVADVGLGEVEGVLEVETDLPSSLS